MQKSRIFADVYAPKITLLCYRDADNGSARDGTLHPVPVSCHKEYISRAEIRGKSGPASDKASENLCLINGDVLKVTSHSKRSLKAATIARPA